MYATRLGMPGSYNTEAGGRGRQAGGRNKIVAREQHRGARFPVWAVAWHNPVMGAQHRQDFRSDETLVDICNHGRPRAAAACVLVVALTLK